MLDFQTSAAIVFVLILSLYLYSIRKKLDMHGKFPWIYFCMYRTKLGLNFMDYLGTKWNKTMKFLGYAGVIAGFLGMILICWALFDNLIKLFTEPETVSGVGLVLPFKAKGVFYVPFFYWIISIFIIALVHEVAHGVIARAHNLKVKSSGFAFFGIIAPIIPAAFVEPDEKALVKRPHRQQLSVFAAGPFSNILLAFLCLGVLSFGIAPVVDNMVELQGVKIAEFLEGDYQVQVSGMTEGEVVKAVSGREVETLRNFSTYLQETRPGDTVEITTDKGSYDVTLSEHPDNSTVSFMGVSVLQEVGITQSFEAKYGTFIPNVILWFAGLFRWLVILNLGIGLFNLVPMGPLDGGRMLQLVTTKYFGKKKGHKTWTWISLLFLALILINILYAFFK